jgi:protein-disulfide isomerase
MGKQVWKSQAIARLRTVVVAKWWIGVMAVALVGLSAGLWLRPVQAEGQIDPKLREQVLQILRDNPEVILESVRNYQKRQDQQKSQLRQSFVQKLKTNPTVVIGQSPTKGATKGKVVLIEFSDFQCPYCSQASQTLKQFMAKHGDQVTLVYKHFPLTSIHPQAMPAAKAAWAAGQQGKFWEYHDALFANQERLGDAFYVETAKTLKLDLQRFERDRSSPAASAAIAQDRKLAEQLDVDATPFFVMNEAIFSGSVGLSEMESVLEQVRS